MITLGLHSSCAKPWPTGREVLVAELDVVPESGDREVAVLEGGPATKELEQDPGEQEVAGVDLQRRLGGLDHHRAAGGLVAELGDAPERAGLAVERRQVDVEAEELAVEAHDRDHARVALPRADAARALVGAAGRGGLHRGGHI